MLAALASFLAIAFSGFFPEKASALAGPTFMLSVLILGMPHGTVDPLILLSKRKASRWLFLKSRLPWVFAYLGLSLAFGLVWLTAPLFCFAAFLLLTAFHWGTSEYEMRTDSTVLWLALGFTRGGLIVLGVLVFQRSDSLAAMRLVTGVDADLPAASLLSGLLIISGLVHVAALAKHFAGDQRGFLAKAGDSALLLILLAFTPALLGMAVYYMFFHALRYYAFFEGEQGSLLKFSHLLCGVTVLGVMAGAYFIHGSEVSLLDSSSLPLHFGLLAALTLPHAVLVTRIQNCQSLS